MLIELYGEFAGAGRYSPAECAGIVKQPIDGQPSAKHICNSYVERQNLTMRMSIRRFTRLTNAFSKKARSRTHPLTLCFTLYNFVRLYRARAAPQHGRPPTGKLWTVEDIVALIDPQPEPAKKRGACKLRPQRAT